MDTPRQLQMVLAEMQHLPPLEPPEGVSLRTYQPGDEADWARIMNECIGEGWTAARCRERLIERDEFVPHGCFMAEWRGRIVGSATAWLHPAVEVGTGYVHMVGVEPEARGKGIGRLVTLATLHWFRDHGFQRVILETDDWRVAAVRTYLRLGFLPNPFDKEHEARWERVLRAANESGD